jgi:hypothetical protein
MKKMGLFLTVMVGLSFLFIPWMGYGQDAVVKDTAVFDKAYIPALFLTSQGKVEESRLSMKFLKEEWTAFKKKYYSAQPNDAQWKKDMDKVEELIMAADHTVAGGKDLPSAHEDIEGAGAILKDARQRNKIEYFPDYLAEFHGVMEGIFEDAVNWKPETLSEKDIQDIQKMVSDGLETWDTVKKAKFIPELHGFSPEKVQKMTNLHKAEEDALLALREAIKKGDKAEIIKHAVSLKPKYASVYLLFGDFERLKKEKPLD